MINTTNMTHFRHTSSTSKAPIMPLADLAFLWWCQPVKCKNQTTQDGKICTVIRSTVYTLAVVLMFNLLF